MPDRIIQKPWLNRERGKTKFILRQREVKITLHDRTGGRQLTAYEKPRFSVEFLVKT